MTDKSADKRVLIPGPDHPIKITPQGGRVVVSVAGRVIADAAPSRSPRPRTARFSTFRAKTWTCLN